MLTKEQKRNYQRDYMRAKRSNNGSNKTEGLTEGLTTDYPPLIYMLVDETLDWKGRTKREKLRLICRSLKERKLLKEVRLGCWGPTMDKVDEVLDCLT